MWYLGVGWHIPPGSRPLVFIQKAVLAGTVSPEMKYSSLNIEGTEAQCLKERQKCSGLPVGTAQRITLLHSLSLFNVVLFKCFGSVILFRIFSPCATPLLPFLGLFVFKREASEFRHVSMDTQALLLKPSDFQGSSLLSVVGILLQGCQGPCWVWAGTPVLIYW